MPPRPARSEYGPHRSTRRQSPGLRLLPRLDRGQADSGISLDEQEHRIRARCHEHSWSIEHVFVDAGVSDSTPLNKRPQGSRLLAALHPDDTMIAVRLDRCFRLAVTR